MDTRSEATSAVQGTYWYVRMELGRLAPEVDDGYLIESRLRMDRWHSATADTADVELVTDLGGWPARPVDEAAWRTAGAPRPWTVRQDGETAVVNAEPGEPHRRPVGPSSTTLYSLGGRSMSAPDLAQLPTDRRQLKAWLLAGYDGSSALAEYADRYVDVDFWLYETTSNLISEMPVAPVVREAAFAMLAELPSMRVIDEVEDALGRRATAVAMRNPEVADGAYEGRVLIDPETGAGLGVEVRVLEPGSDRPWAEPGLRLFFDAVVTAHWSDDIPAAVEAGATR